MSKFVNVQRLLIAALLVNSNPCLASNGELDNENRVVNSGQRTAGAFPIVIVRENTRDGSRAVAINKSGVCNDAECNTADIQKMEFQDIIDGKEYALATSTQDLAHNELNNDPGADRESWFWAVLFVGAAITAIAWNNTRRARYYSYNPYWSYNYGNYYYRAYGYGCGYVYGGCAATPVPAPAPAPAPYYGY